MQGGLFVKLLFAELPDLSIAVSVVDWDRNKRVNHDNITLRWSRARSRCRTQGWRWRVTISLGPDFHRARGQNPGDEVGIGRHCELKPKLVLHDGFSFNTEASSPASPKIGHRIHSASCFVA